MGVSTALILFLYALATLAVVIALVGFAYPSLAEARYMVVLSEIRESLARLAEADIQPLERDFVAQLDEDVFRLLHVGAPPISFLVGAAVAENSSRGRDAGPEEFEALHGRMMKSRECWQRESIDAEFSKLMRETLRAGLLGSRFWLVLWPVWLAGRGAFSRVGPDGGGHASDERRVAVVAHAVEARTELDSDRLAPAF